MYVQYQNYLEALTNQELINEVTNVIDNDTLRYIIATTEFSHAELYSEAQELLLYVKGEKFPVEEIEVLTRKEELVVLEYFKRYNKELRYYC